MVYFYMNIIISPVNSNWTRRQHKHEGHTEQGQGYTGQLDPFLPVHIAPAQVVRVQDLQHYGRAGSDQYGEG